MMNRGLGARWLAVLFAVSVWVSGVAWAAPVNVAVGSTITVTPFFDSWWVNGATPLAKMTDGTTSCTSGGSYLWGPIAGWGQDLATSPTMVINLGAVHTDVVSVSVYNGVNTGSNLKLCSQVVVEGSLDGVSYDPWGDAVNQESPALTFGTNEFRLSPAVPQAAQYIRITIGWSPLPQLYSAHALTEVSVMANNVPVELSELSID